MGVSGKGCKIIDKLYAMLEKVRLRPGVYLGAESITCFYQFIAGYHMGLLDSGLEKYEQLYPLPFYEFFPSYCTVKYQETHSISYAEMFLKQCRNKERDAMRHFFEIMDEYKDNARIVGCEICELSEENMSFHLTDHHVIKKVFHENGNWISYSAYQHVQKLYHISFSFGVDLLIPVSEDKHVGGTLLYRSEKGDALAVFEGLEKHMKRCFGNVSWQEVRLSDEQILSLLNDYIFHDKKTRGI